MNYVDVTFKTTEKSSGDSDIKLRKILSMSRKEFLHFSGDLELQIHAQMLHRNTSSTKDYENILFYLIQKL